MKKGLIVCLTIMSIFVSMMQRTPVLAQDSKIDLSMIETLTEKAIEDGIFPGASILVKKGDVTLFYDSFGDAQIYDMGEKINPVIKTTNDTLYDLASVRKVMATTQALMMLNYQSIVNLDEKVATYMPDFAQNGKGNVTVRDLLTHTSGLTPWKATFLYNDNRAEEKVYVNNLSLEYETGTKMAYSDFSFMALSFMVEEIVGMGIEDYLKTQLYQPLGMNSTTFVPLKNGFNKNQIAATSWGNPYEKRMSNEVEFPGFGYDTSEDAEAFLKFDGWREFTLIGEVNDGNAGMANEGVAGHAGLFSTTKDLSILGDVLLKGGTLNGKTLYDQSVIDEFTKAYPDRFNRGLGWQVNGNRENAGYVGKYASDSTFSHAGFTGTQVIFDSEYDLQVIILTNKMNFGTNDKGSYASPYRYSRDVMNLVFESLNEDIKNVSKETLKTSLETKKVEDKSLYSEKSFAKYEMKQTRAQSVYDHVNSIQEEVDLANKELLEAYADLVDLSLLKTIIKETLTLNENDYTEDTWIQLLTQLSHANTILMDEAVQQTTVDETTAAIRVAIAGLKEAVGVVDKKPLETLVLSLQNLKKEAYTSSSWETFSKDLKEAQSILENKESTQPEMDAILKSLQKSKDALVSAPVQLDTSKLEALIKKSDSVKKALYTESSYNIFENELKKSKAAFNDATVQSEIDAALSKLNAAYEGLKMKSVLPSTGVETNLFLPLMLMGLGLAFISFNKYQLSKKKN